jgi:hypothetical protein
MVRDLAVEALEQRVLTFTAIHSGTAIHKLSPATRLAQDLDIKGDDASEFFDAFSKEFRVKLGKLNMRWDQHFHPQAGLLLSGGLIVLGCVTLAGSLLALFSFGGLFWSYNYFSPYQMYRAPIWAGSAVASLLCWFLAWYRNRGSVPITIADLIDAARAGHWVKSYGRA